MLDFRRTLWALWLGTAVVGMLGHTPIVLAQIAVSANDNKLMLVNGAATGKTPRRHCGSLQTRPGRPSAPNALPKCST